MTVKVRASRKTSAKIDVRVYDPQGRQVLHRTWDRTAFSAGVTRTFRLTYYISASRPLGTYSVRVRIWAAGTTTLLSDRARAATFRVRG